MSQPARKKTDADATETNQLDVTGIFCGKLLTCPAIIRGRAPETKAKTRDPSGGTAGRVKLYGRLGWMGACAEYSLDGEGFYRSHIYWSRRVAERSNGPQFFLLRGRPIGFANSRLVGSHGGTGLVQVPGRGNLLMVRDFLSGM